MQPVRLYCNSSSADGFNVVLQALPIPDGDGVCKIVLRAPKDERSDHDSDRSREHSDRDDRNDNKSGSRRR